MDVSGTKVQLTRCQQRVMGYIAAEAVIGGGACVIAKGDIARAVRCSTKTVDRAVKVLCAQGLLSVEERFNPDGGQTANAYLPSWDMKLGQRHGR